MDSFSHDTRGSKWSYAVAAGFQGWLLQAVHPMHEDRSSVRSQAYLEVLEHSHAVANISMLTTTVDMHD